MRAGVDHASMSVGVGRAPTARNMCLPVAGRSEKVRAANHLAASGICFRNRSTVRSRFYALLSSDIGASFVSAFSPPYLALKHSGHVYPSTPLSAECPRGQNMTMSFDNTINTYTLPIQPASHRVERADRGSNGRKASSFHFCSGAANNSV